MVDLIVNFMREEKRCFAQKINSSKNRSSPVKDSQEYIGNNEQISQAINTYAQQMKIEINLFQSPTLVPTPINPKITSSYIPTDQKDPKILFCQQPPDNLINIKQPLFHEIHFSQFSMFSVGQGFESGRMNFAILPLIFGYLMKENDICMEEERKADLKLDILIVNSQNLILFVASKYTNQTKLLKNKENCKRRNKQKAYEGNKGTTYHIYIYI